MTDDRITCRQCQNLRQDGFCNGAMRRHIVGASSRWQPEADRPRRCEAFVPEYADPDRRVGLERWPGFKHPAMKLLTEWVPNDSR